MNVTFTPAAEKFMRRMVRFGGDVTGFRLQVSAGGCSGLSAEFTVEKAPQAGDSTFDLNGLPVYLPAESRLLLEGVTVDFSDSIAKSGFTFINPNAAACACSSSEPGAHHGHGMPPGVATVSIGSIQRRS